MNFLRFGKRWSTLQQAASLLGMTEAEALETLQRHNVKSTESSKGIRFDASEVGDLAILRQLRKALDKPKPAPVPALTPAQARAILREIDDARLQHRPSVIYADEPARKATGRFLGEKDGFNRCVADSKDLPPALIYGLPVVAWEELDDLAVIRADGEQQEGRAIIVAAGRVNCKRKTTP